MDLYTNITTMVLIACQTSITSCYATLDSTFLIRKWQWKCQHVRLKILLLFLKLNSVPFHIKQLKSKFDHVFPHCSHWHLTVKVSPFTDIPWRQNALLIFNLIIKQNRMFNSFKFNCKQSDYLTRWNLFVIYKTIDVAIYEIHR